MRHLVVPVAGRLASALALAHLFMWFGVGVHAHVRGTHPQRRTQDTGSKEPGRFVVKRDIDLPRPRELELTYTTEFTDIVHELRGHIGALRRPAEAAR